VRFVAACRRFLSMAQVVHDVTGPWLRGGRAKDIIESSESSTEAISEICTSLLKHFRVVQESLGMKSDVPRKERLCRHANQEAGDSAKAKFGDMTQGLLSLVNELTLETANHIRSIGSIPPDWVAKRGLDRDEGLLEFTLRSLDCTRWQVLKEFAKLVNIFDDHEDSNCLRPSEAWRRDQAALDNN
jgi:hypothetical protein